MKKIIPILLFALIVGFTSCNKDDDPVEIKIADVVINELLSKNSQYGSDEDGDFDDWIELYNPADVDQDISGYYLSDSKKNPTKWQIPEGTIIEKMGYLIIWCDEDSTRSALHTNYKLSGDGENVVFLDPDKQVISIVEYPSMLDDQSWARKPNGTGDFERSVPSFNMSND